MPNALTVEQEAAERIIQSVCELDPSDYPDDDPNTLRVSDNDLRIIVERHVTAALLAARRGERVLRDALANVVVKCVESGAQDGDFVLLYKIPTGPIHHAIPLLESMGVTVRPGFDGRAAAATPEGP